MSTTTDKNPAPTDLPPASNGHGSNGVTHHEARRAAQNASSSIKKRKKKKPSAKAGAAATAASAAQEVSVTLPTHETAPAPDDSSSSATVDQTAAASSAETADLLPAEVPVEVPLAEVSPAEETPIDASPAEDPVVEATAAEPDEPAPDTVAADILRLRMKVWTDPTTGKRFLMPSAFMRDVVNGQPVSDVMYAYAMSDEETKLVLLRAHEWNTLPFHYFNEDGPAPRASSRPMDVVVSGGRPS